MAKRNWKALKKKWLSGKYADLKEFSEAVKIPYDTVWRQSKVRKWRQLDEKVTNEMVSAVAEDEAEEMIKMRRSFRKVGAFIFVKSANFVKDNEIKDLGEAMQGLKIGSALQQAGYNEQRQLISLQQNNQTIIFNEAVEAIERDEGLHRDIEKLLRKRLAL